MADRKISDLTALTTPASGDFLPIVDISEAAAASKNKRITIEELMRGMPDGTAAAPSIAFESDPNTGIYSPGADQLAISTNGTGRLFIDASGNVSAGTGPGGARLHVLSGAAPNIAQLYVGQGGGSNNYYDANNHFFRTGNLNSALTVTDSTIQLFTDAQERMRLTSAGLLGLGTSDPGTRLDVRYSDSTTTLASLTQTPNGIRVFNTDTTANNFALVTFAGSVVGTAGAAIGLKNTSNGGSTSLLGRLFFATKKSGESTLTEAMCIDESQRVGIGSTAPTEALHIVGNYKGVNGSGQGVQIINAATPYIQALGTSNINDLQVQAQSIQFQTGTTYSTTERARIDSSGRLLIGTSTSSAIASSNFAVHVEGTNFSNSGASLCTNSTTSFQAPYFAFARSRGTTSGSNTIVQNGDSLGYTAFYGADGDDKNSEAARIGCEVDGTPGANDMPGRLMFFTTADGAASPTERLRITSAGVLQVADAGNITVGTTTGTKIGTATTQKLGFYDKTPVVQPIAVADATDAASAITQLNALLARMRDLGLIAT